MSAHPLQKIIEDATILQRQAADPDASIWVMASAGTGKTTVLVDRFIRLVLAGTQPDKILCLTYTKAAATQMKDRILRRLSKWVTLDDAALAADVAGMTQQACTPHILKKARSLFSDLLDQMDRLNIMTIHSFCQSLLARFQIEAGLAGGVEIMEDARAKKIFSDILTSILAHETGDYIERLSHVTADADWPELVRLVVDNREGFHALISRTADYRAALNDALRLTDADTGETLCTQAMQDIPLPLLEELIRHRKKSDILQLVTACPEQERIRHYHDYLRVFMNKDNTPSKLLKLKDEFFQTQIAAEQIRLIELLEKERAIRTRDMSADLIALAQAALLRYEEYKTRHAVLDYHDLIYKTLELLSDTAAADWIRFKLDGGIDQVLVDEAQDTSPAQWHIIRHLIEEYFSGTGNRDPENRTLFVVGDTKQSIFGFHGADPETATRFHAAISHDAGTAGRVWRDVPLDTSFRTAQDILDVVDACSAWGRTVHRAGKPHAGRVELWPLLESIKEKKEDEPWQLPDEIAIKTKRLLIDKTADKIKQLLDDRIGLPSKNGQAIEPQDILILVRTRGHYPVPLIQALRQRQVPVAGIDSFSLTDDLAVQDVLSVLRWSLFPDDDLALAEILKSPFVAWDDTQIGHIAIGRSTSLWQALSQQHEDIAAWLGKLQKLARRMRAAPVIQTLLERPCPADSRSGYRALQKRLGPACLDALEQLLSYARDRELEEQGVLAFIQHLERFAPTIKREMEGENARGVRIMTTHGAKGLEAPVVIMLDTIVQPRFLSEASSLQWAQTSRGVPVPLWAPRKDDRALALENLQKEAARKEKEEYYRLLYVGMTRAKDYLIVSGAASAQAPSPESWYFKVREAMQSLGAHEESDMLVHGGFIPLTADVSASVLPPSVISGPDLGLPIDAEDEIEDSEESVSRGMNAKALSIERQWHKLLERAIDRAEEEWEENFPLWLEDLPDINPDTGRSRLLNLRNHAEYGFLFMPGGAAEVPFITLGETVTRGRIDRLVITEQAAWIIDYKTRLNPADSEQKAAYEAQLDRYKSALAPILKGLPVQSLLVDIGKALIQVI